MRRKSVTLACVLAFFGSSGEAQHRSARQVVLPISAVPADCVKWRLVTVAAPISNDELMTVQRLVRAVDPRYTLRHVAGDINELLVLAVQGCSAEGGRGQAFLVLRAANEWKIEPDARKP